MRQTAGEGVFTTHVFDIVLPKMNAPFRIAPIGDVHYSSPGCDRAKFLQTLTALKNSDIPTYYLWMGDETDTASFKERRILADDGLHDSTLAVLDQHAADSSQEFFSLISFMKDRTIGMLQGNHYWRFQSGDKDLGITTGSTSTAWLAKQLNAKWLGWLSYIRLRISAKNTTQQTVLDLVACHGRAGGKLVGTSINQLDDLRTIFPLAHLYMFGHDHKCGAWPVSSLYLPSQQGSKQAPDIKQLRQFLVRTGSFLRAYVPDETNYVTQRLLRPADLGTVVINCRAISRREGALRRLYIDMQAIT